MLVDPTVDELASCTGLVILAFTGSGVLAGVHKLGIDIVSQYTIINADRWRGCG